MAVGTECPQTGDLVYFFDETHDNLSFGELVSAEVSKKTKKPKFKVADVFPRQPDQWVEFDDVFGFYPPT